MKGDFSRPSGPTIRPYNGVLHQQGRVWLDSDWNDEVFERLAREEAETSDAVGSNGLCAVPNPGNAFRIVPIPGILNDFAILGGAGALGRAYVDGLLVRADALQMQYTTQPSYPNPPPLPVPSGATSPLGSPTGSPVGSPVGSPPHFGAPALAYLEVWRRLITAEQDPAIRETALGGPDTTVRLQTVAQVKVISLPPSLASLTCADAAAFIPTDGAGTLSTMVGPQQLPPDPCRIPDPQTYTGQQNALYRVEVHDPGDVLGFSATEAFIATLAADAARGALQLTLGGTLDATQIAGLSPGVVFIQDSSGASERVGVTQVTAAGSNSVLHLARGLQNVYTVANSAAVTGGAASFKWSRTNAADAFAVVNIDSHRLTVTLASLGRDQASTLRAGDLVEITDDGTDLTAGVGHLTYITADPDPDAMTVTLADPVPGNIAIGQSSPGSPAILSGRPLLRRWDGAGIAASTFDPGGTTPQLDFGDGIRVVFGGNDLRSADYWQFAARAIDGSVDLLQQAAPNGIERHRAPLAVIDWQPVPSVSTQAVLQQVQSSAPVLGQALAASIRANLVQSGHWAISEDMLIRASTAAGASPAATSMLVSGFQNLLTAGPVFQSMALAVVSDCRNVFPPLTGVVPNDDGIHVKGVAAVDVTAQLHGIDNDLIVPASNLAKGLQIACDQLIDPRSVTRPTCFVSVELPYTLPPAGSAPGTPAPASTGATAPLFYYKLELGADVGVLADGQTIFWSPHLAVGDLANLAGMSAQTDRGVLTRLTLKGNFIRTPDGTMVLDGDAFGAIAPDGHTALQFPSGDGRKGGDFLLWFWLQPMPVVAQGLYIVNQVASMMTLFRTTDRGGAAPSAVLDSQSGLAQPSAVALDAARNIYIANGAPTASRQQAGGLFTTGLARTSLTSADLLATEGLLANTGSQPLAQSNRLIETGFSNPGITTFGGGVSSGIQFHLPQGEVFNQPQPPPPPPPPPPPQAFYILVFKPGAKQGDQPMYSLGGSNTQISRPTSIAVDAAGTLYVANGAAPTAVLRFNAGSQGNVSPVAVLSGALTGITNPSGIAVDTAGRLYVINFSQEAFFNGYALLIFASSPGGNTMPAIIRDPPSSPPMTAFNGPVAVAVGPKSGAIYVACQGDRSVTVINPAALVWPNATEFAPGLVNWPAGPAFNPNAVSSVMGKLGGSTNPVLSRPSGIAIDSAENIYVSDQATNQIVVFAEYDFTKTSASQTSIGSISGPGTLLAVPIGAAVG